MVKQVSECPECMYFKCLLERKEHVFGQIDKSDSDARERASSRRETSTKALFPAFPAETVGAAAAAAAAGTPVSAFPFVCGCMLGEDVKVPQVKW